MKKHLSLAAALVLLLSVTGCAANESSALNGGAAGTKGDGFSSVDIGGRPAGGFKGDVDAVYDMATGGLGGMTGAPEAADGFVGDLMATDPSVAKPIAPGGDITETPQIPPQSGLLTGGEWNDNAHWSDWKALYDSHSDWNGYKSDWRIKAVNRLAVKVENEKGEPVEGAEVTVSNWMKAVTDNKGMAYLFGEGAPSELSVTGNGGLSVGKNWDRPNTDDYNDTTETVVLDGASSTISKKLDLMIMCDTTGSMSDELEYLKEELSSIIKKIKSDNSNIPTRVSVNFYRDEGDEYIVRQFPFSSNIDDSVKAIGEQSADGGGDFPEAVHTALDSAINNHDWSEDSVKIMFLVLDAPPHSDAQIVDSVNSYVKKAAEIGIRIIPIASSGIDKSTEYLLRTMAFTTGGTYTFLTNDSGIGGEHIEPTVGAFNVEKLSDMMVRIVNSYLE